MFGDGALARILDSCWHTVEETFLMPLNDAGNNDLETVTSSLLSRYTIRSINRFHCVDLLNNYKV